MKLKTTRLAEAAFHDARYSQSPSIHAWHECAFVCFVGFVCLYEEKEKKDHRGRRPKKNISKPYQEFDPLKTSNRDSNM